MGIERLPEGHEGTALPNKPPLPSESPLFNGAERAERVGFPLRRRNGKKKQLCAFRPGFQKADKVVKRELARLEEGIKGKRFRRGFRATQSASSSRRWQKTFS